MKIVIIADPIDNQNAGIHFYVKNLILNLLKSDKKTQYIFIHNQKNQFFKNTKQYIIPTKTIFGKRFIGCEFIRKFFIIPKFIKKINPDLVLETAHFGPFNLPKKIRRAVTIYDLSPILFPQYHIKLSALTHKIFFKSIINKASLILSISNTTKKDIKTIFKTKAKIITTYLGVSLPFKNFKRPNIKLPYIFNLGTIEPRKNLINLIDAFNELKKEIKIPHKLVIAGEVGWKADEIIKKAMQNSDTILLGRLSEKEKASWYKFADMFIYPSFYEGFGLPPLEAMSYGIPVICSTGGSLGEIFSKNALMFDPEDKNKLKEHILTLIQNPDIKQNLAEKGKNYSQLFTWEKTAKKTIEAFKKTVNTNQKPLE